MATADLHLMPRVEAGFGVPTRQNRWTVAFRFILVIPQFIVVWFLGIVASVLVLLGWFAALVIGRLPPAFVPFVTAFIQYQTRVYTYGVLMTDVYPPFSFEAPYPVNVDTPATPVRRLAVLFRLILFIPAGIVSGLVGFGLGVASFVVWLIVLINGSMPPALFWAVAAIVRFQARAYAYLYMVTDKYPGELFGDATYAVAADAPAVAAGPPYGTAPQPHFGAPPPPRQGTEPASTVYPPPPYPTGPPAASAGSGAPPVDVPAPGPSGAGGDAPYQPPPPMYFGAAPATTAAGAYGDPAGAPPGYRSGSGPPAYPPAAPPPYPGAFASAPRTGPVVLTQASKGILVLFLVLGSVGWVLYAVAIPAFIGVTATGQHAARDLLAAHEQLSASLATVEETQSGCGENLTCAQSADAQLASAFAIYQSSQARISFPSGSQAAAAQVTQASSTLVALLRQLSTDGPGAYASDASRLQTAANSFDTSFQSLAGTLPAP